MEAQKDYNRAGGTPTMVPGETVRLALQYPMPVPHSNQLFASVVLVVLVAGLLEAGYRLLVGRRNADAPPDEETSA